MIMYIRRISLTRAPHLNEFANSGNEPSSNESIDEMQNVPQGWNAVYRYFGNG